MTSRGKIWQNQSTQIPTMSWKKAARNVFRSSNVMTAKLPSPNRDDWNIIGAIAPLFAAPQWKKPRQKAPISQMGFFLFEHTALWFKDGQNSISEYYSVWTFWEALIWNRDSKERPMKHFVVLTDFLIGLFLLSLIWNKRELFYWNFRLNSLDY